MEKEGPGFVESRNISRDKKCLNPYSLLYKWLFLQELWKLKIILQGTDTYLTFAKGKTSSTVFWEGICPFPPPKKKRTILETQTHLAGTGLVLRQFFEAVVDFNKNTPSKVHCSEPVLPSCLLPKKMFQRRYHYGCRFSRMSMEY